MNADILRKAGIDYDCGVKRFMGRERLYEKELSRFSRDNTFDRITEAFYAGDDAKLLACAHEFKGMCGNIALGALYDAADVIVLMLRAGDFAREELEQAYNLLDMEYHAVYDAVAEAMGAIS